MSALIGALRVSLSLDSAAFEKGADLAQRKVAGFSKQMQNVGAKMASIGAKMSIGLTAPLTAFGVSSFKAATDAAELDSAFNQTFGRMAVTMDKWAEKTGNALSRSTREMKEAANTFGIFFNTAAPPEKAAEMSRTFAVLAQDLSSFFNVDTATAIEKLRAGLSGEAEPLRAFGVFLNEASVKAKALELGLGGVGGALTDQEKILARYALIMEQTSKAQGDVLRTQSGTANQIRAAKAAWEELQITVGTKLLPILTPLITKIAEVLNWFTQLPKPVQNAALAIAAVTAVCGPFLIAFGAAINAVSKMAPLVTALVKAWGLLKAAFVAARIAAIATLPALIPFLVPLGLLAAAVGAVYLAWKNWDKIKAIVTSLVNHVTAWLNKLAAPFNWVIGKAKAVGDAFFRLYDRVVGHSYIPDMVDGIGHHVRRLDHLMVQPIEEAVARSDAAFNSLGQDAIATVGQRLAEIGRLANDAMKNVAEDGIRSLADGLTAVILGTAKLGDVFRAVAAQIVADLIRIQIQKMLMSFATSIGIPLPSISGARAMGGPVMAGSAYLVGERGPEIFMPNSSGQIVPNHEIAGGGHTFNFHVSGNVTRETASQLASTIQRRIAQSSRKGF